MKNLLAETVESIAQTDHAVTDVAWVGSADGRIALSWEQAESRLNVDYDAGYGGQEIATDLVVVFADGSWLERGEYDGSEWWDFQRLPQRRADAAAFTKVRLNGLWESLATVNGTQEGGQ